VLILRADEQALACVLAIHHGPLWKTSVPPPCSGRKGRHNHRRHWPSYAEIVHDGRHGRAACRRGPSEKKGTGGPEHMSSASARRRRVTAIGRGERFFRHDGDSFRGASAVRRSSRAYAASRRSRLRLHQDKSSISAAAACSICGKSANPCPSGQMPITSIMPMFHPLGDRAI